MAGPLSALQISLDDQTRTLLQRWMCRPKTPAGLVRRARALLLLEQEAHYAPTAKQVGLTERNLRKWAKRFRDQGIIGLYEQPRSGRMPVFLPEVALHVVKLACERPDQVGRSLVQWQCSELARQLKADGIDQSISSETVRRILQSHKLKPWRHHLWLSAKVLRDQRFAWQIQELVELYTHPLTEREMVSVWTKRPTCSRVRVRFRRCLLDQATQFI